MGNHHLNLTYYLYKLSDLDSREHNSQTLSVNQVEMYVWFCSVSEVYMYLATHYKFLG